MEHISTIHSPEIKDKNMSLSSVAYISNANLIVLGTDLGKYYFYDMIKSSFLKTNFKIKHEAEISHIYYDKTRITDFVFITSLDGIISSFELEKQEIKVNNHSNENQQSEFEKLKLSGKKLTKNDLQKLTPKELQLLRDHYTENSKGNINDRFIYKHRSNKDLKEMIKLNENNEIGEIKEDKENEKTNERNVLHRYIPNLRASINVMSAFEDKKINEKNTSLKVFCSIYSKRLDYLFTGCENGYLLAWNYLNGTCKFKYRGREAHVNNIVKMVLDGDILITSDVNCKICVWSTELSSLLYSISNKINLNTSYLTDMIMIPKLGIVVLATSDKQFEFWKYETKELVKTINSNKDISCVSFVDYYGKLLYGTSENSLLEKDIGEVLDSIQIKHKFNKFPFLKQIENKSNDDIDNYRIMKSINKELF